MSLDDLPKVLESETIDFSFVKIIKEKLSIPHSENYDYYTLQTPPVSVMVLATTVNKEYVLNWEYRHPVRKILLSCPGGLMDEGEDPLKCAERELREETGFSAKRFEMMGQAHPFPGICNQLTYFVRAYDALSAGPKNLDPQEFIETELFTPEKLKEKLNGGVAVDGLLLTALFFAHKL